MAVFEVTPELRLAITYAFAAKRVKKSAVAAKLGVSNATISCILSGKTRASGHLLALCKELGIPEFEVFPLSPKQKRLLRIMEE